MIGDSQYTSDDEESLHPNTLLLKDNTLVNDYDDNHVKLEADAFDVDVDDVDVCSVVDEFIGKEDLVLKDETSIYTKQLDFVQRLNLIHQSLTNIVAEVGEIYKTHKIGVDACEAIVKVEMKSLEGQRELCAAKTKRIRLQFDNVEFV